MREKLVVKKEVQEVGFTDALYNAVCGVCKEGLEWQANFDADGTSYRATCCKLDYFMYPSTVTVEAGVSTGRQLQREKICKEIMVKND